MNGTEIDIPEPVADALLEWALALHRLSEPLTDEKITDAWIAGLIAGTRLRVEHGKEWVRTSKGGYPRALPFVVEFPCPFGHRSPERYDRAKVRIIIEDNGWWSLDPESPCEKCSWEVIRDWLLTCPRCEAGEESDRHYLGHEALDVGGLEDDCDASPVSWVIRELQRLTGLASAHWWVDHYTEAVSVELGERADQIVIPKDGPRMRLADWRLACAREVLGAQPKSAIAAKPDAKPKMTPQAADAWLDTLDIPAKLGEKATWAKVKDMPGCPAQAVIYAAVKVRKSRATAS